MALGPNLVPNPGAEVDTSNTSVAGCTQTRTSGTVRTGVGAFELLTKAPTAPATTRDILHLLPERSSGLIPGQPTRISVWVRPRDASRKAVLLVEWKDHVSTVQVAGTSQLTADVGAWTQLSAAPTMPANATRGLFYLKILGCQGGEVFHVDDYDVRVDDAGAVAVPSAPSITAIGPARSVWPDPIRLSASGQEYDVLSWAVTGAPAGSTASIVSPTTATPTFTPQKLGVHTFTVTATGSGGTATSSVTVSVRAQMVRYGADLAPQPVRLGRY